MRSGSLVAGVLAMLAVMIAAALALLFPLTSNPGPESAQLLGVVGGVALAMSQAARAAGRSQDGFFADALGGLLLAAAMLGVFLVATTIGGALRPSCAGERGYLPFFFLSVPVLVLQTGVGTWIGRLVGRRGIAALGALLLQIGVALWLFVAWYQAPGFQVASHFFVVLTGDLLQGAEMPPVVIGYRAATLLFGCALLLVGAARWPRIRRTGLSTSSLSSPLLYAFSVAALVGGLAAHALTIDRIAPRRAALERTYTLVKQRGPLVVHADPVALRPRDVDAMLAEGTLWLDRLALRLGQKPQGDVHVWLHATREEQARWTGARHVDFTLPWRREIHIVGASVPHDTLGHELAHALAGELSDTLLRIPSDLVVFQHAAVVEGLAVALTPELAMRHGLTVKEQAAAMKRLGFAPGTAVLFSGLSFFAEPPARAYVAAGAFIESLVARSLPDPTQALAALYKRGSLEDAMGSREAAEQLVVAHDALLDSLTLPPDAALVASERFQRPSILRDVCEPEDAERARAMRAAVRIGDADAALEGLGPLPSKATLEDLLADARVVGDDQAALALAARIEALENALDLAERTEKLGDTLWRAGRRRDAVASWDRARADSLPIDKQRSLIAKRVLAQSLISTANHAPVAKAALDVLLATTAAERADSFERMHYWLGAEDGSPAELRHEPRLGVAMARYIHARRLVHIGALEEGARQFRRVLDEEALPAPFLEQARLGLATALTKMGAAAEASELLIAAADGAERPASRLLFRDRAERAGRAALAPEAPARVTATSDPTWADRLLLGIDENGEL
jgi:tetratricopeptide (TPR) repeat protein